MFQDFNFKLAVISALMEDGHYVEEAEALSDAYGDSAEDHRPIEQVIAFYRSLEIPAELLATVTTLAPDGGDLAYMHATAVWDGEDDQFDITSLEGIEHLVNLEIWAPTSMIGVDGVDYTPLLRCTKLTRVDMEYARDGASTEAVREELTRRGVEIEG